MEPINQSINQNSPWDSPWTWTQPNYCHVIAMLVIDQGQASKSYSEGCIWEAINAMANQKNVRRVRVEV